MIFIYGWWDNKPYDGVHKMLSDLRASGKRLIVATSKPEHISMRVLKFFELDVYFDFIGGASTDLKRDTKEQVLSYALESVGCTDRSSAILVGDRKYDAEGARLCGIDSLGVLWGHGSAEEIGESGFDLVAATPEEVVKLLL